MACSERVLHPHERKIDDRRVKQDYEERQACRKPSRVERQGDAWRPLVPHQTSPPIAT
jgi:hypothetical protein